MTIKKFFPCTQWFKLLNAETVKLDFMAGLTGAIIVLPQGVAFATIAGLPPQYGLYTAIVIPIIAALFGSSYHLVSGPTTAISIIVFASVSRFAEAGTPEFISMALMVTFLAGVYQLIFGALRLGSLINFVSHSVITGFTAGSAILVMTSQLKSVTGISFAKGQSFYNTWISLFAQLEKINPYALGIALATLAVALISKKIFPRAPNLLAGMIFGSILALFLKNYTETITFVAEIPAQLPQLSSPTFSMASLRRLAPEGLAIALIGLIEATSISRSIAAKSNQKLDSNQEFIAQGLANITGSFFSCYAASGSFTRSGLNYEAGAKTPLSAIFAAILLMLIVLLVAPMTAYLPVSAMGGVIFLVGYNLINFKQIKEIIEHHRSETAILAVTFFGTLFVHIEFAISFGVLLSLMIFLARTSTPYIPSLCPIPTRTGSNHFIEVCEDVCAECPQFKIIRIDTPIYFGSVSYILNHISNIIEKEKIKHILIVAFGINGIDLTGAEALVNENNQLRKIGGGLYFVDHDLAHKASTEHQYLLDHIGQKHFFQSKVEAINTIFQKLDRNICADCTVRIFAECLSEEHNKELLALKEDYLKRELYMGSCSHGKVQKKGASHK
ncbi:SulP family inorganic anion transporter [Desulfotalea psychrophila]|uniref:Probable high affinity sulfate transporter (SulP) n=1 Tax=Desulfotalea psychrophila (strain LSv54 / DSM 12343) TaxID=177439 RepID=Q6APR4_DESPS|nr:SulP family inorganic anion transporter [Desulfotalea psychrophila]CAG35660.1 probable high affinity sulfate transporter (SulP) [Desulfotalea psychrophila LSv54]